MDLLDISALQKSLTCYTENVLPFLEIARMAVCNGPFQYILSINNCSSKFIKIIFHEIECSPPNSETHKTAFKVLANMFFFPYGAVSMFNLPIFDLLELPSSNQRGLATLFSNYVIYSCQPSQVKFYNIVCKFIKILII